MSKIRVKYAVIDNDSKTFRAIFPLNSTFADLQALVKRRTGKNYSHIFFNMSEIDSCDMLGDWIESSDDLIVFSDQESTPSREFMLRLNINAEVPSDATFFAPKPDFIPTTVLNNQSQTDLSTPEAQALIVSPNDEFIFLSTASKKMLFEGIKIKLNMEWNPQQCQDHLLNQLQANGINIIDKQLLVYLPGGLPFLGGQLKDIYTNPNPIVKHIIYGVLADKNIPTTLLNSSISELCNISNRNHQRLISPLCNSSFKGLCDIACLLGYLNYNGVKGDLLFRSFATVIHFAPQITSMMRIINRQGITGRDVVTFCSTFYAFSRQLLPETISNDKVYEYGLRICNLVSHINDIPEVIPAKSFEILSGQPEFLCKLKQPNFLYFYLGDIGNTFNRRDFSLTSLRAIDDAYKSIQSFTPIAPLSIRYVYGCSIIRGKDHTYLYVKHSSEKSSTGKNKVDIIDPSKGFSEAVDLEQFAQEQGSTTDDIVNLIDPDNVKQVIQICFDESGSMISNLGGHVIDSSNNNDIHRITLAYQYLIMFANRAHHHIPCIQGLVSFNDNITVRYPLGTLVPDVVDKVLQTVTPGGQARLWDAIYQSAQGLVKYMNLDDASNLNYRNAKPRILVISAGDDFTSSIEIEEVAKELIKYNIILDSVIISNEDTCKPLCALSHITGGLSFRPEQIVDGLRLFEMSAFFDLEVRKQSSKPLFGRDRKLVPQRITPEMITKDFMTNVLNNTGFDTEIINKELAMYAFISQLVTPRYAYERNKGTAIGQPRHRRILREFYIAAEVQQPGTSSYDPDLKIYAFKSDLDRWKVCIKGPDGTPYANKWWYLFIRLPPLYPIEPPVFHFVSIPYHLNVSHDGFICLDALENGYTRTIVELIQEIKKMFLTPSTETPISLDIYQLYHENYDEYLRLARKSAQNNAKDNYEEYLEKEFISDCEPVKADYEHLDYQYELGPDNLPLQAVLPGNALRPKNVVYSSTGVPYDRHELLQLITTNKNPICVITGKPLTDNPNDLKFLAPSDEVMIISPSSKAKKDEICLGKNKH